MSTKKVDQSRVVMANIMLPHHANYAGNVHGGEIMKMMDNTAGVVAAKHARTNVVTARVDELQFHHPIRVGNVVTCSGKLTFVGKSSMEVLVKVTVEDLAIDDAPKTALTAYFTMVSLNEKGAPQHVPQLELCTVEEKRLFDEGGQRYSQYKRALK